MSNRASAILICDSISQEGHRLRTFQLRYWRPIHSELLTHRVLSRNAGSSRARPSKAIIEQVQREPWGPIHWGMNEPGMQANQELSGDALELAKEHWKDSAYEAGMAANRLVALGAHKQIVNRVLEPYTYIDVVLSGTDFNNWYALRDHPDAQPEIRELAQLMKTAEEASTPKQMKPGDWHLPFTSRDDWHAAERFCQIGRITRDMPSYAEMLEVVRKISVARCARVSYKAFDGNPSPIEKDIELFEKLLVSKPLHASPAEHQATPDELVQWLDGTPRYEWKNRREHGNFRGWCQYRKMLPDEFVSG